MLARVATSNAMVTVGIYLHVKLLALLHQCFGIFGSILEVHVVVSHTMNQQQVAAL